MIHSVPVAPLVEVVAEVVGVEEAEVVGVVAEVVAEVVGVVEEVVEEEAEYNTEEGPAH